MFAVIATGDLLSNAFAVRQVSGRSMQVRRALSTSLVVRINEFLRKPTLNPNSSTSPDYVLINKYALWFNEYNFKRGDIVALRQVQSLFLAGTWFDSLKQKPD